jgi:hypothetical protein
LDSSGDLAADLGLFLREAAGVSELALLLALGGVTTFFFLTSISPVLRLNNKKFCYLNSGHFFFFFSF